jgi:ribosomal protein S18 acetylase RimI-like enzyme
VPGLAAAPSRVARVEIVRLRDDQLAEASAVLGRAFHDDPAWSWVLRNARHRARLLPWLFEMGFRMTEAELWTTAGPVLGCARWLPPGRPHVNGGAAARALLQTPFRVRTATRRFLAYGRAVDELRFRAVPEPHWYLAGIGVEPVRRREGIGGALLAPGVDAADRAGIPTALLTNAEQNLSFYRRHGFEVVLEGSTPAGGPHAWMMVRRP